MKCSLFMAVAALICCAARASFAGMVTASENAANFGTLNQTNVGANTASGSNNFCAPTATMNSFTYLANTYPQVYGNSLLGGQANYLAAAQVLASAPYMNTNVNTGTTESNWVNGKQAYLDKFAPGLTTYAGMDSDATNPRPAWDENANPTVFFLLNQLQQGEDVELGIDPSAAGVGHVLTLTGLTWNDANNNLTFDAGDTLTLNTIDPANPGVNTPLTLSPGNPMTISGGAYNTYLLTGALAESPVPEPAAVGLLLAAGALLARRSRRLA